MLTPLAIKTAGGSPAADYYSCFAKKSNQKKANPGLPPLRGSLAPSQTNGAAELALRAQTVLAYPSASLQFFEAVHRGK